MRAALLSIVLALVPIAPRAAQTVPTAGDLAREVQSHYDTVHDFRAGFTQTETSAALHNTDVERGDVRVKKPNRMYWNYTSPERHQWVADGAEIFDVRPAQHSCSLQQLPQGDDIPVGVLFLAGRGNLSRDFTAAMPATQPTGHWVLALTPRKPEDAFASLTLVVDRTSFQLSAFMTTTHDGDTSRFDFAELRENVGLSDHDFAFSPPRGIRCD